MVVVRGVGMRHGKYLHKTVVLKWILSVLIHVSAEHQICAGDI